MFRTFTSGTEIGSPNNKTITLLKLSTFFAIQENSEFKFEFTSRLAPYPDSIT